MAPGKRRGCGGRAKIYPLRWRRRLGAQEGAGLVYDTMNRNWVPSIFESVTIATRTELG